MADDKITFGSVCSGIEAASVAWHPLGWRAAWFAEIEPFPCAALAHHYPKVPNLGDMRRIADMVELGLVDAPDILCGGTPCQAFSVAGLRRSLDDARGNLSLTFCEIANAIDERRLAARQRPCIVFWENVPGVLSTKDNAFGCFLAGLAGEDDALVPPGGKWSDAGAVFGPSRAVAWRVLDGRGTVTHALRGEGFDASEDGTGPGTPLVPVLPFDTTQITSPANYSNPKPGDPSHPLTAGANAPTMFIPPMQVRRLTPRECERLQGFPDDYTAIPWRNKPANECPDGPRYKALGNSWAVPVVRWIGSRIADEILLSELHFV
jgi:site-specific DNA-cytosine methylase